MPKIPRLGSRLSGTNNLTMSSTACTMGRRKNPDPHSFPALKPRRPGWHLNHKKRSPVKITRVTLLTYQRVNMIEYLIHT